MSRSFGDMVAHKCGVTEIPEIKILNYKPDIHKGLILASDGIWEYMTNIKTCQIAEKYLQKNQADQAADLIVINALQQWKHRTLGYIDDTSCIVAFFR